MRPNDDKTIKLWPALVAAVILVFVLLSFQHVVRLDARPPQSFVQAGAATSKVAGQEVAEAYWSIAVNVIQWKYNHASELPDKPPLEFALVPGTVKAGADSAALRMAYWSELRRVWLKPETWHSSLDFDLGWTTRAVNTLIDDVRRLFQ